MTKKITEKKPEDISVYKIPKKNCIITAHKNPDGDAISSCVAVYNFLISKKKRAAIRLEGGIPENLEWMLEDIPIVKNTPDWAEQLIVLDSNWSFDRLGWNIPDLPVFNIDHHVVRIKENDSAAGIHVIEACSVASLLFRKFGIKDKILVVGVYTDTYFTRHTLEAMNFLLDMNVSEEEIEYFLDKVNYRSDKKTWHIIRDAKVHSCRNGFVIVETEETDPAAIENAMCILNKMNESVCLIYGSQKDVKLRTTNKDIDVSKIAKIFLGGGHKFAAQCRANGRTSELKSLVISLEVP